MKKLFHHTTTLLAIVVCLNPLPVTACTMVPSREIEIENEFEIEIEYEGYDRSTDRLEYEVEIEVEVFSPNQVVQCQCALGLGNLGFPVPTSFDVTNAVVGIRGEHDTDFEAFDGFDRDFSVEGFVQSLDGFLEGANAYGFSLDVSPFETPPLQAGDVLALAFKIEFDPDHFDLVNGSRIQFAAGSNEAGHELSIFQGYEPTLVLPFPNDAPLRGDVNLDGELDDDDLEDLCSQIAGATNAAAFDLDGDGLVSSADLDVVLGELGIVAGDADLDGSVDFADFLTLSMRFGKSESFDQGDFNCSGTVDFADFLLLSKNFGTTATQAVPEPHSLRLMLLALLGLQGASRRRRRKGN